MIGGTGAGPLVCAFNLDLRRGAAREGAWVLSCLPSPSPSLFLSLSLSLVLPFFLPSSPSLSLPTLCHRAIQSHILNPQSSSLFAQSSPIPALFRPTSTPSLSLSLSLCVLTAYRSTASGAPYDA